MSKHKSQLDLPPGNIVGTKFFSVMDVRKLQELFLLGCFVVFFFFITSYFLQHSLRVNLKINLSLQQPVSKEKQNPTDTNYYLILYVHVYMHHLLKASRTVSM